MTTLGLWKESKALTATTAVFLAGFAMCLAGLVLDPRTIGGMPAWMKPAKFAISSAIFTASMAWLFTYLDSARWTKRLLGPALSAILLLEVGLIAAQALRGTSSHFNIATPLDTAIFSIMGAAIGVLWACTVWILVALFRQRFVDVGWGWALRLGMLISVLGSASAGLMLGLKPSQLETLARHEPLLTAGAHTVGAPDGGPGLPVVGWSTQHGDLRIPHFLGLHGLQIVPLAFWWLRRKRGGDTALAFTIAGGYLLLMVLLAMQALRGESITETGRTMSAQQIFSLANGLALLAWLMLAIAGRFKWAAAAVCGVAVPVLLALGYLGLLIGHWGGSKGGFGTLAAVAQLFSDPWLLLAGWIHYLCFDLFIGAWEVRDSAAHGISHWLVIPCLFLTFMFGPVGLLLYLSLRFARTRRFTL